MKVNLQEFRKLWPEASGKYCIKSYLEAVRRHARSSFHLTFLLWPTVLRSMAAALSTVTLLRSST